MRALLIRLDAPLMSFGAPLIDSFGVVQEFPGLSLLTGLFGNALGYRHGEADALNRLQDRIRYAVCRERQGEKLRDFQTIDFARGSNDLKRAKTVGWTRKGRVEQRAGSADTLRQKHIRYRDYWAGARYLIALALEPAGEAPDLNALSRALREPRRPLFIGRKTCLPARPLLVGVLECESLVHALQRSACSLDRELAVWWAETDGAGVEEASVRIPIVDERDWTTQLHGGQRIVRRGVLRPEVQDER